MKRKVCEDQIKANEKNMYTVNELILLVIAATLLGIAIGFFAGQDRIINGTLYDKNIMGYKPDKYLTDFISVYDSIKSDYYQKVDKQELMDGAIEGMLNKLNDPYTVFMSEKETKNFDTLLEGNYLGIGIAMETTKDGVVVINGIFPDTPALKAGLKVGDQIINVNGKVIGKTNASEVVTLMRDDKVKTIDLTVLRESKPITLKIKKARISIPSVLDKVFEKDGKKIGYIKVNLFSKITPVQFKESLSKLEKQQVDSLIIDVRNNSGGYLKSLDDILALFMTKKDIIYQVMSADGESKTYAKGKIKKDLPVVVLINGNSASASEILAAAFQETYGAKLVGEKTYGKGTVQKAAYLETGGMYKYTTQNWLTPSGNSINEKGINPDYNVVLNEAYSLNPTLENDNQLQSALQLIIK